MRELTKFMNRFITPKKQPAIVETQTIPLSNDNYPEDIKVIHREFYFAADELLKEANSLIAEAEKEEVKKGSILNQLGFTNTRQAKVFNEVSVAKEMAVKSAKYAQEYAVKYPVNKFITEDRVRQICEKYNLVFGDVSLYKGFVPQKNLNDIASFKLKEEDTKSIFINGNGISGSIEDAEIKAKKGYHLMYKKGCDSHSFQSTDGINFYGEDRQNSLGMARFGFVQFSISESNLKICAPLKDMETKGYELKGHKLVKHIPDPIVLKQVRGGYLIVTMWADENFDPKNEPDLLTNFN